MVVPVLGVAVSGPAMAVRFDPVEPCRLGVRLHAEAGRRGGDGVERASAAPSEFSIRFFCIA